MYSIMCLKNHLSNFFIWNVKTLNKMDQRSSRSTAILPRIIHEMLFLNNQQSVLRLGLSFIMLSNMFDCFIFFQERPRPTFAALAPAVERNPVTGLLEPHFPEEKRFPRIVSGIAIVICMVRKQEEKSKMKPFETNSR